MTRRELFHAAAGIAASAPLAATSAGAAPVAGERELPFRQVHLDFHTSELVADTGSLFDAKEFAATLRQARVNSINVFAKCHHGYAYYPTKIGTPHPALKTDMLGGMVEQCRAAGIAVNYYYSLVWDVLQSRRHPEWRCLDREGRHIGLPPGTAWPWVCMNTPYFAQVVAENREILERYKVGGAFFDILKQPSEGCFCKWCREDRAALGLLDSPADVFKHNKLVALRVEKRLFELVRSFVPDGLVFFNSRIVIGVRDELPWYSHLELESLPTGGWGYTHFHQRVRYLRTLGKQLVGMTGRFHKSWGDFGGLKNQAALDFECLNFLAHGTKPCIGDQLHPRGRLDPVTYERIGKTYAKVEALEPWSRGARALADIGVYSEAATNPDMTTSKVPPIDQGFTNMLNELHQQFDVLDAESEISGYKVVIVPDDIRPVPSIMARLERFVASGGAVIVSNESLLEKSAGRFALSSLGVRYRGPAKFEGEYMLLKRAAFPQIDDTPYFLYRRGVSIEAEPGTEVLATYGHPYFDRADEHFVSHKQTPFGSATDEPLITKRGRAVYVANPFFRSYQADAYGVQKQVVAALLEQLLPDPLLLVRGLPSTGIVTVLEQPRERRQVVHLLHYPMTRRAPDIDIIEEPGLAENVEVRLRRNAAPAKVTLVPQGTPAPFRYERGYAAVTVRRLAGHQAVAFE